MTGWWSGTADRSDPRTSMSSGSVGCSRSFAVRRRRPRWRATVAATVELAAAVSHMLGRYRCAAFRGSDGVRHRGGGRGTGKRHDLVGFAGRSRWTRPRSTPPRTPISSRACTPTSSRALWPSAWSASTRRWSDRSSRFWPRWRRRESASSAPSWRRSRTTSGAAWPITRPRSTTSPAIPSSTSARPNSSAKSLFDEMGLPGGRKGKTGAYGTGAGCRIRR